MRISYVVGLAWAGIAFAFAGGFHPALGLIGGALLGLAAGWRAKAD